MGTWDIGRDVGLGDLGAVERFFGWRSLCLVQGKGENVGVVMGEGVRGWIARWVWVALLFGEVGEIGEGFWITRSGCVLACACLYIFLEFLFGRSNVGGFLVMVWLI